MQNLSNAFGNTSLFSNYHKNEMQLSTLAEVRLKFYSEINVFVSEFEHELK